MLCAFHAFYTSKLKKMKRNIIKTGIGLLSEYLVTNMAIHIGPFGRRAGSLKSDIPPPTVIESCSKSLMRVIGNLEPLRKVITEFITVGGPIESLLHWQSHTIWFYLCNSETNPSGTPRTPNFALQPCGSHFRAMAH